VEEEEEEGWRGIKELYKNIISSGLILSLHADYNYVMILGILIIHYQEVKSC